MQSKGSGMKAFNIAASTTCRMIVLQDISDQVYSILGSNKSSVMTKSLDVNVLGKNHAHEMHSTPFLFCSGKTRLYSQQTRKRCSDDRNLPLTCVLPAQKSSAPLGLLTLSGFHSGGLSLIPVPSQHCFWTALTLVRASTLPTLLDF